MIKLLKEINFLEIPHPYHFMNSYIQQIPVKYGYNRNEFQVLQLRITNKDQTVRY